MRTTLLLTIVIAALLASLPAFAAEACGCGKPSCAKADKCADIPACNKCARKRNCCKDCKPKCECVETCEVEVAPKCTTQAPLVAPNQQGPWIIDPSLCPRAEYTQCCERAEFRLLGGKDCGCKGKCKCSKAKSCGCGKTAKKCKCG